MYTINTKIIEKSSLFNEPRSKLWWRWTTKEGLHSFFGYDNQIELTPGGPFEIYFLKDNPEGTKGGEGNKILSFLPEEMLSFTWNAPPQHELVRNHSHRTWVVLNFEKKDDQQTRLSLRHIGWLDGEEWDAVYHYFRKAWDMVFKSLSEVN